MRTPARSAVRLALLLAALGLITGPTLAAQRGQGRPAPDTLVRQVRVALGHGAPDEAQRLVDAAKGPAASKELAAALVEVFRGQDAQARTRLEPLVRADATGEAALELGLLELRHGQRSEAHQLLDPMAANRTLSTTEDYFLLARAARAVGEFLLANDAYQRIADVSRADIQTEWGDLFLQRHQPGDAVANYKQALKIDPAWVPAELGLARAQADDAPDAAQQAFDQARKLAPDDPDVWMLAAERQVDDEKYADATQALDRVARGRPGTVEEAALRAVVAWGLNQPADMDAALARVQAIDPTSAEGYRRLGEQAASTYRFDDATVLAKKAVAIDPDDAAAQLDLGLYQLRTGEEAAGENALNRSWDLDKSNAVTKNLLAMLDSLDKFTVVPDGPLVFKFAPDEAAVLKPYALPLGELAYKTFSEHYGFTPTGPILVEVFPTHDDFAVRTTGLMGIVGALGACFGRVVTMDSPKARPPGDFSWQATEWHELAHVFTLQLSDYRVPRWLTEGISAYEEHARQPAWGRELTLEYAQDLAAGQTFGVKGLPEAFKNPAHLAMAYFEASLVVEHLVDLKGFEGLRALLKAYAGGASDTQAFQSAFGMSLDQVDASFKTFVAAHYGALSAAMKNPPGDVDPANLDGLRARAAAAPGNFISQITYGQALVKAGDLTAAVKPLERAAELAPEARGSASPHALLAQIAEQQGDMARARQELRALLTWDHTNVNAARKLVTLSKGAAGADADLDFGLRLVTDLDPFDADAHGLLGARLLARKDYAAALVEFQATLALNPANLAEAHANVAEAQLRLGHREEAKHEALEALKLAPTYARAQDLLLEAMGKGRR
jgi:tetratricopeptide (TPR) repeat protein